MQELERQLDGTPLLRKQLDEHSRQLSEEKAKSDGYFLLLTPASFAKSAPLKLTVRADHEETGVVVWSPRLAKTLAERGAITERSERRLREGYEVKLADLTKHRAALQQQVCQLSLGGNTNASALRLRQELPAP
jgi:hypothetical protein